MHIDPNAKYACWFMSHAPLAEDWPDDAPIAEGAFAARGLGIQVGDHWVKWLGSLVNDEIAAGGLTLYVTAPSSTPKILDGENQELQRRCHDLLYGLVIQGVPDYQRALTMTGAHVDGEIQIRNYAGGREMIPTYEREFVPGRAEAERAGRIAMRLRQMQDAAGNNWGRLLRVTRVLLDANRTDNRHGERFHEFVRVLDGLVKTRPGRGATDFVHRVQTFALDSPDTSATLIEMYALRGAVEHVNSLLEAILVPPDIPPDGAHDYRVTRMNRLTRQLDALVRFVLVRIFEHEELFELFRTEDSIGAFWRLPGGERAASWGERVDIRTVV
jgi:hypothetical protein